MTDTTAQTADGGEFTIPDSPTALEELLHDQKAFKQVLAMDGGLATFIDKYAQVVAKKHQDIATQVDEQVQATMAQWLKDNREQDGAQPTIPLNFASASALQQSTDPMVTRQGLYNPAAMGAVLDKEFKSPGEFFSLIWSGREGNRDAQAQAQLGRVRNAFTSTVPSEGGFLIPEVLRSDLLRLSLETAVVRPRARVIPMETLRVPFPSVDETSHVSSVYGGIVGYWTEEGAALTESSASFGRVVLDAKKLTAYTEVPSELLADSIGAFNAFLTQVFPEALSFYEDDAFINGSGVGEPLGFLNGSAVISVTRDTDNYVFNDIVAMYTRMLPQSLNRAVWIVSPAVVPSLLKMVLATGDATIPVVSPPLWLPNQQAIGAPTMSILGRPVIVSEKVPNLATANDITFVDLGFYLIGDRQVMSAQSSSHFRFNTDKEAFRIIERVDGRPWINSAITPKNNGDTLSPFVGRAA
jgi:HK97 family phage major capsid protein